MSFSKVRPLLEPTIVVKDMRRCRPFSPRARLGIESLWSKKGNTSRIAQPPDLNISSRSRRMRGPKILTVRLCDLWDQKEVILSSPIWSSYSAPSIFNCYVYQISALYKVFILSFSREDRLTIDRVTIA